MTSSRNFHVLVALMMFAIAGLSAVNWMLMPQFGSRAAIAVGTMAGIWIIASIIRGRGHQSDEQRRYVASSVLAAGAMVAVGLSIRLAGALDLPATEVMKQVFGVAAGLVLVGLGNVTPKILGPLTAQRCAPAQCQALQRFVGWTFVLAGIAFSATWLVLPVAQAGIVSMGVSLGATALVLARCAWTMLARPANSN
jgi:hypothetical protein